MIQRLCVALALAGVVIVSARSTGAGSGMDALPAGGLHVLFIGNSLTYTNNLPGTVSALAASVGDTIRTRSVALPNLALIDHLNGSSDALAVIRGEHWDFVVLQQGPSSLPVNRDTLVLATKQFDPAIKASGAISAQFMTWPSSDRPQDLPRVLESSRTAAGAVGGVVFAAGQAWARARARDSTLTFYGTDGYHPSELGTYLSAIVIYECLTGRDAQRLPKHAVVNGRDLRVSEAAVQMLQQVAHESVVNYRSP
ncbi:hypothetical protein BH09GEM1_BH09GEM1_10570 [soil metagenome]